MPAVQGANASTSDLGEYLILTQDHEIVRPDATLKRWAIASTSLRT